MKYRSRTDIIASILQSAGLGASKTRIMYNAFLSYAQLKEYLALLQGNNLIAFDDEIHAFRLTPRGSQFLDSYERLSELIAVDQRKEETISPRSEAYAERKIEVAPQQYNY
jgi:predicted transcriptional regulator